MARGGAEHTCLELKPSATCSQAAGCQELFVCVWFLNHDWMQAAERVEVSYFHPPPSSSRLWSKPLPTIPFHAQQKSAATHGNSYERKREFHLDKTTAEVVSTQPTRHLHTIGQSREAKERWCSCWCPFAEASKKASSSSADTLPLVRIMAIARLRGRVA